MKKSNTSNTTISRIENGEIENPDVDTLYRISKALKLNLDYLLIAAKYKNNTYHKFNHIIDKLLLLSDNDVKKIEKIIDVFLEDKM